MPTPQTRVRELIERSGMSQGQFAEAVGLDAPKMSKSLGGARRFTSLDYARIAALGQVSVDWLLSGREPDLAMAARASSGTSARTAVDLAGRLAELRGSAQEVGYPQPVRAVDTSGLTGLAYTQGGQLAHQALQRVAEQGMSSVTGDLALVIEAVFGIDVSIADLGSDFDGLAASTPHASVILVSPSARPARQRFTMAHELGHLLGADDQGVHADADIDRATVGKDPTEVRANAFAASFLMPEGVIRQRVESGFDKAAFCRLAVDLLVSPQSLAYRLKNLGFIDAIAASRFGALPLTEAARLAGRVEAVAEATTRSQGVRPPGLLARDLFAAYLAGSTTLRPYASLLGKNPGALRAELGRGEEGR